MYYLGKMRGCNTLVKTYNYEEFKDNVLSKYLESRQYEKIEKPITDLFENRNSRFVSMEYHVNKAVINIYEANVENFIKKVKSKYKFMVSMKDEIKVYIFEYAKPYYRNPKGHKVMDIASTEIINDIYIFHTKLQKVIAYTEIRLNVSSFQTYFQDSFVGFINVDEEFKKLNIATFMLRLGAFYMWVRYRKRFNSDTLLSEEMLNCCRTLCKKTKWVIREDYYNDLKDEWRERYLFIPPKLNINVSDSNQEFEF